MAVADLIAQTLAQHIANPRVISYAGTKKDEVQGRFIAANRVYNFVLDKKGVSYSPAGRNDSLVFSALFLERLDAARKPKVGSDKCNAGKSYQCGKSCISNRWNCRKGVKDVNDARRIASILASTNEGLKTKASGEVSEKAQARGRALFEARQNREANPKTFTPKVKVLKDNDVDTISALRTVVSKKTATELTAHPKSERIKEIAKELYEIDQDRGNDRFTPETRKEWMKRVSQRANRTEKLKKELKTLYKELPKEEKPKTLEQRVKYIKDIEERISKTHGRSTSRAQATTKVARSGNLAKMRDWEMKSLSKDVRDMLAKGEKAPETIMSFLKGWIEYDENGNYAPINITSTKK